jgi:hypothetical protein
MHYPHGGHEGHVACTQFLDQILTSKDRLENY